MLDYICSDDFFFQTNTKSKGHFDNFKEYKGDDHSPCYYWHECKRLYPELMETTTLEIQERGSYTYLTCLVHSQVDLNDKNIDNRTNSNKQCCWDAVLLYISCKAKFILYDRPMKLRDQTNTDNFLSAFQLNSCSCLQEQVK